MVTSSLSGGGATVTSEQPQKSADTDTVSSMTTRRQAASRSGNETTDKNYGSVQGTDSAQAGPAAKKNAVLNKPFSTQAMDFVQPGTTARLDLNRVSGSNVVGHRVVDVVVLGNGQSVGTPRAICVEHSLLLGDCWLVVGSLRGHLHLRWKITN
ncbi:hypothetical protein PC116_g23484 [Phytophthora cactorum]|uniref:Uncharacterized protein n=1 Tax=Phytophthora cactorum TaxID=29920 RepID=A0A8T1K247_9STRA|nr:hypothetical protein Pcac1_g11596 [Phytophthora cactorum]KAG2887590.1 hypothetical protein PC114_g18767 [Phytophthora cactorum]KAG2904184.1 hypothetical protein PC117_g21100 [Phytophthora cactorum]KAG4228151.1 hypothetical protein PC116_g23484 [Phytophthora cactorum]